MMGLDSKAADYWSEPADRLAAALASSAAGLSRAEAARRLSRDGPNVVVARQQATALRLFLRQFASPLVLILLFAAIVSAIVRDWIDAAIILAILVGSTVLGFIQEYRAANAVARLQAHISIKATVVRDGRTQTIPADRVVPGDVVLLSAGNLVPADGLVVEAKDFFVTQAVLTGETFPVEKEPGTVAADASLAGRTNCVFMGTSVRSGTARVVIARTGLATVFGEIADRLALLPPEGEFERGIRHFGYLLTQVMAVIVIVVFAANLYLERPLVESLLFAVALAVGLSPELLPAIMSVTLSAGARKMAESGVIVRHLSAIENLGSMDVLCTDKTGTLTEGVVRLDGALDPAGKPAPLLLRDAALNARLQTGLANPLDEAIAAAAQAQNALGEEFRKLDEIPYDFVRKRLSVVVAENGSAPAGPRLISKGALANILEICNRVAEGETAGPLDAARREEIARLFAQWSSQGYRVLGVAAGPVAVKPRYTKADETGLVFAGFLLFLDPPKTGIRESLAAFAAAGARVKIVTGDSMLVAVHLAEAVGMPVDQRLTGKQLNDLPDEALWHLAERTDLFAEVDPNQKERIILALKRTGHVVGFLGDGINDAPALHAADVGISVDSAVDVAKQAADFVLLKRDLDVLRQGIEAGRTTFANTLKYIAATTSANFGNMISMAAASLFLPFLPLLAKQILLNNFLSDLPAIAISTDHVDRQQVERPHRWDIRAIRRFMILFGLVSSLFDFLTFGALLYVVHATAEQFRTGWFIESLLTELLVVFIIRTAQPFYRSRPGRLLLLSSGLVVAIALLIPYLPFAEFFEFTPLPLPVMAMLLAITALYVGTTEVVKRYFYRRTL
jgi:P-type Mg2+ transporter